MKRLSAHRPGLLVLILTFGVFGIINTEMGVVGIIPRIAETFGVTVPEAGWTVSVFALIVALSAPVMPLLFSGVNRRTAMLLALGLFTVGNIVSALTDDFAVLLVARAVPAFLHPVYVSMAFSVAAASVPQEMAPKAVSKVFVGVSAGMVLGVPVTGFIAGHTSVSVAMAFFAIVNASVLIATIFCIPSLPVQRKLSYGAQLGVLRKAVTWHSVIAFTFINGAMFGFFSYMSDFLDTVTELPFDAVSVLLLVYGGANIVGNVVAGRLLFRNARRCMIVVPFLLSAAYLLLFATGSQTIPASVLILVLGILAGIASNTGQYMISDAAPEAPDFANGLFLTSANLGTTVGTAVCGVFITGFGSRYSLMGALLFLAAGIGFVLVRNHIVKLKKVPL
ncbi:MFS transporter [Alistipes sp. kh20]|uniref:MFS transporter n=1 Tax=Alistipes montrealensis TaxID=2834113 RepID=UPI001BCCE1FD|nr:MFS transporter [Alistipes montrealensis]MBS4764597.1 MFS transporter [Alistipes montrealensis]